MKKTVITIIIIIIISAILTGLIVWYFRPEEDSAGSHSPLPEEPEKEVTISANKKEYRYGETVIIKVKNNLDNSIWYLGNLPSEYPWWRLEKYNKEEKIWEEVDVIRPLMVDEEEECIFLVYEPVSIDESVVEIQPGAEVTDQWDLKNCYLVSETVPEFELGFAQPGTYRLFFNYVLDKESYYQEAGSEEVVYSNEFLIRGEIKEITASRSTCRAGPHTSWLGWCSKRTIEF